MRTRTQKFLLIALACVLGGGILAAAAWGLGAQTSIHFPGSRMAERQEFSETLTAFDRLDVRIDVSNLTLREGTQFEISGHYYGDISFEVRGNTLFLVADTPTRNRISIGFNTRSHQGGDIIITVPALTDLEVPNLSLGVGNIRVQNVALHNARITNGVGNIDINGPLIGRADISSGVGDIDISALITGRADIDSGVGDIRLRLPESRENFSYSGTVGVGNISIDGSDAISAVGVVGATASHTVTDPIGEVHFSSGVGNVRIDFRA